MHRASGTAVGLLAAFVASSCLVPIADSDDPKKGGGGAAGIDAGSGGTGGTGGGNSGTGGSSGNAGSGGTAGLDAASGGTAGQDAGSAGAGSVAAIPGLLGHWPFDDGSGTTAKDITPLGNHGTLPWIGATWTTSGVFGGAIQFSDPAAGVTVAAWSNAAFPSVGTVTVWVQGFFAANEPSNRGIFDNYDGARNHLYIRRANNMPAIEIQCAFQPANQSYAYVQDMPIAKDAWQLVAIAWDVLKKQAFCYVHGTRMPGFIQGDFSPSQQSFEIGDGFIGVLDDVRLYDHMLTEQELAVLLTA